MAIANVDVRVNNAAALQKLIADGGSLSAVLDKVVNGVQSVGSKLASLGSGGAVAKIAAEFDALPAAVDRSVGNISQKIAGKLQSAFTGFGPNITNTFGASIAQLARSLASADPVIANMTRQQLQLAVASGQLDRQTVQLINNVSNIARAYSQGIIPIEKFRSELARVASLQAQGVAGPQAQSLAQLGIGIGAGASAAQTQAGLQASASASGITSAAQAAQQFATIVGNDVNPKLANSAVLLGSADSAARRYGESQVKLQVAGGTLSQGEGALARAIGQANLALNSGVISASQYQTRLDYLTGYSLSNLSKGLVQAGQAAIAQDQAFRNNANAARSFGDQLFGVVKVAQIGLGPLSGVASRVSAFRTLMNEAGLATAAFGVTFVALAAIFAKSLEAGKSLQTFLSQMRGELATVAAGVGFTSSQLNQMVESIKNVSLVDVSQLREGINVLLTFPAISGDQFRRTLQLATDMSAVFGTDIPSSIRRFARALEDPAQNLSAITRLGVSFNSVQKDQISLLQQGGEVQSAQNIIIGAAEAHFKGAAAAAGKNNLAGALNDLHNTFRELFETISAKSGLLDTLRTNIEGISQTLRDAKPSAEELGKVFNTIFTFLSGSVLKEAIKNIDLIVGAVSGLIIGGIVSKGVGIIGTFGALPALITATGDAAAGAATGWVAITAAASPWILLAGAIAGALYILRQREQDALTPGQQLEQNLRDQTSAFSDYNDQGERALSWRESLSNVSTTVFGPLTAPGGLFGAPTSVNDIYGFPKLGPDGKPISPNAPTLQSAKDFKFGAKGLEPTDNNVAAIGASLTSPLATTRNANIDAAQNVSDQADAARKAATAAQVQRDEQLQVTGLKLFDTYDKLGANSKKLAEETALLNVVTGNLSADGFRKAVEGIEKQHNAIDSLKVGYQGVLITQQAALDPNFKASLDQVDKLAKAALPGLQGDQLATTKVRLDALNEAVSQGLPLSARQRQSFLDTGVAVGLLGEDLKRMQEIQKATFTAEASKEVQAYQDRIDLARVELSVQNQSNDARKVAVEALKLEQQYTKDGNTELAKQAGTLAQVDQLLGDAANKSKQVADNGKFITDTFKSVGDGIASDLTAAFDSAGTKGKSFASQFRDNMLKVGQDIQKKLEDTFIKLTVTGPFSNLLSGAGPGQSGHETTIVDLFNHLTGKDKQGAKDDINKANTLLGGLGSSSTNPVYVTPVSQSGVDITKAGSPSTATGTATGVATNASLAPAGSINNPMYVKTALGGALGESPLGSGFGPSQNIGFTPSNPNAKPAAPSNPVTGADAAAQANFSPSTLTSSFKSALTPTNLAIGEGAAGMIGSLGSLIGETIGGNAGRAIQMAAQLAQMIIQTALLLLILIVPKPFGFASGGAFAGGMSAFAAGGYTNSVVSSPTMFGMGGSRLGVMGEAGPEAIMPLTRTSNGTLGVHASGSGGGAMHQEIHIHPNTSQPVNVRTETDDKGNLRIMIEDAIEHSVATGGKVDQTMQNHYQLERKTLPR